MLEIITLQFATVAETYLILENDSKFVVSAQEIQKQGIFQKIVI